MIRERMKAERKIASQDRSDAPIHAASNFFQAVPINAQSCVALYDPIGTELHIEPLFDELVERGIETCLPIVVKKKAPLVFRRYRNGQPLIDGAYGARTPEGSEPLVEPTIIIAPLLAFTKYGDRLGYGGGFYDRTLEQLRKKTKIIAVGYAYGVQQVDELPVSRLDQRLDWVITERSAIRC